MRRYLPSLGTLAAAAMLTVGIMAPGAAEDSTVRPNGWIPWSQLTRAGVDGRAGFTTWVPWAKIETDADSVWKVAEKVGKPAAARLDRASRPLSIAAQGEEIDVIAIAVNPQIAKAPATPAVIDDALRSLRTAADSDPRITAALRERGVTADDVIGVVRTDGALNIIIGDV